MEQLSAVKMLDGDGNDKVSIKRNVIMFCTWKHKNRHLFLNLYFNGNDYVK